MGITVILVQLVQQLPGQLFWLWASAFSSISPLFFSFSFFFFFARSVRGVCSSRVRN